MTFPRPPAVAGSFYPADPRILARMVDGFLSEAADDVAPAKAIIAPHAGYIYSGPVAATAYKAISPRRGAITRVVLLGPAHRWGFSGIAAPSADAFLTPLGPVAVDRRAIEAILDLPEVSILDAAFEGEHSLETHLPFIQRALGEVAVVPLVVGQTRPAAVAAVLERLWGGEETLIIISTDLSHFHAYDDAKARDLATSRAIETLAVDRLSGEAACGFLPVSGVLLRAGALDLRVTSRDLRSSGDTQGGRDRVVGYGAFTLEDGERARLSSGERAELLDVAGRALAHVVACGHAPEVVVESFPIALRAIRRTFVTLEIGGRLRGCIGSTRAVTPLVRDVVANTLKSAIQDPRFNPLTADEVKEVTITVSILSHGRPIAFANEDELVRGLRPHQDGLIIQDQGRGALFLPKVWDALPDAREFLNHLKDKAGLDRGHESGTLQAIRFSAETFATN